MSGPAPARVPDRTLPDALARSIADGVPDGMRLLVALDHDGTLSPIAPRPDQAVLEVGARDALGALAGRAEVAIISGRGLDDLVARFAGLPVTLVSEHGLRRRGTDGRVVPLVTGLSPERLDALRGRLEVLLPPATRAEGWLVEDKGVGIAVHHRLVAPERLEPTRTTILAALLAADAGGQVQEGKAVLELRAAGADKAGALARLLDDGPPCIPVMVGDDLTDEPALALAEARGGTGVLVAEPGRPSAASVRVTDPAEVVALLRALAEALTQGR